MMYKVLMTATVASMIGQFNMSNLKILKSLNYEVFVACDFNDESVWSIDRIHRLQEELKKENIQFFQVDFSRNPFNIRKNKMAYKQLRNIINEYNIDFIHCHTPVAGVISRIVAHRENIKVIYTAHGFHFFSGAPLKNWILFYPIEKMMSRWTDVLITINKEDYERANKKFYAKRVIYIPGVGVDVEKFSLCHIDVKEKRKELRIPIDAFVLLSVGELQKRKNQRAVIEAVHNLNNSNIYYLVVGQGELINEYQEIIDFYGLKEQVRLLGFRTDIKELCKMADCFVHPSVREGLGIAPLEAMASGLPLISSYLNGMKDYTEEGKTGCCLMKPLSLDEMTNAIKKMYSDKDFREKCGNYNKIRALEFDKKNTNRIMKEIYNSII